MLRPMERTFARITLGFAVMACSGLAAAVQSPDDRAADGSRPDDRVTVRQPTPKGGAAPATRLVDTEGLAARYAAAIQQRVLASWIRPESMPDGVSCRVQINQLPGGMVVSARVDERECPLDAAGRTSVEAAVLRADPLPYKGFEPVFQRTIVFRFRAG